MDIKVEGKKRRRFRWLKWPAIIVIILIGGFLIWLFRPVDAKDPQLISPTAVPGSQVYTVRAAESVMNFELVGTPFKGKITIDGEQFQLIQEGNSYRLRANLTIDALSVDVGTDAMNQIMVALFKGREYPKGKFVGESETLITDLNGPQELVLVGELELGGVINPQTLTVTMNIQEGVLTATSTAQMDVKDFVENLPPTVSESVMDVEMQVVADYGGIIQPSLIFPLGQETAVLAFIIESELVGDTSGNYTILGERLELAPVEGGWKLIASFLIDGTSVNTGNVGIDRLINIAFNSREYPYGKFIGESADVITDLEGPQSVTLVGQLELTGQVNATEVPIDFEIVDNVLTATAKVVIDVRDFGVNFPEALGSSMLNADILIESPQAVSIAGQGE